MTAPPRLVTAILGAGAARRMRGADKLLEPVDGVAVLRRLALAAAAAGGPVAVTLRDPDPERAAALAGLDATLLPVPAAAEGMAASIRSAAAWAEGLGAGGLMLCPGDMPELEAGDFAAMARAFDPGKTPVQGATETGAPGHPVAFPARFLPALAALTGDRGAKSVLAGQPVRLVPMAGQRAATDLDTPEAWAVWRARRG